MTKSQVKKERRQKAKEAEAKIAESAPVAEEVQAPIIGRKRKTKKAPAAANGPADTSAANVTESASPAKVVAEPPKKADPKPEPAKKAKEKEQPAPEIKPVHIEEQPTEPKAPVEESWRAHNTVAQAAQDAEKSGRSIKDILVERTKPIHELLAALHQSSGVDLHKNSLFNPASLGQRTDMKCSADDYDAVIHPIELTEEHRKSLERGEPIRAGGDQLKHRFMVTPRGCVLRHFEPEEEERYLALEKNQDAFAEPFVVGDDITNINGGLDALFATSEKFDVCWMDDAAQMAATSPGTALETAESIIPPNILSAMEADSARNHDWAVAHSADLLQTTAAAVRSFAAATAKQMLSSVGITGTDLTLAGIAALTNDEMKSLAGHSQKELETTRKELDSLDKKFSALLRRNKKLLQQALSTADEA